MVLEFWALTFDTVGKILIAVMALLVHRRIKREGGIGKRALKEMKLEQSIGVLAILLIITGYVLHLYAL